MLSPGVASSRPQHVWWDSKCKRENVLKLVNAADYRVQTRLSYEGDFLPLWFAVLIAMLILFRLRHLVRALAKNLLTEEYLRQV